MSNEHTMEEDAEAMVKTAQDWINNDEMKPTRASSWNMVWMSEYDAVKYIKQKLGDRYPKRHGCFVRELEGETFSNGSQKYQWCFADVSNSNNKVVLVSTTAFKKQNNKTKQDYYEVRRPYIV